MRPVTTQPDLISCLEGEEELFFSFSDEEDGSAARGMQRIHGEAKKHKCLVCGKSFSRSDILTSDQRIHIGENPYKCLQCSNSFCQSGTLTSHRKIHTGEKPYKCLECGNCFSSKGTLTNHERIHTEKKPYKCLECGKSFRRKNHLTSHQRTVAGEDPYKCRECGNCFRSRTSAGVLEPPSSDLFLGLSTKANELLALPKHQQLLTLFREDSDSSDLGSAVPASSPSTSQLPAPALDSSTPLCGSYQPSTRKQLCLPPPLSLGPRFQPTVWKYFRTLPSDPCVAECQVCYAYVRRGKNLQHLCSSVLRRHLQRAHPSLLPPEENVASGRKKRPTASQQGETEGDQESPPRKAPCILGAVGGTSRQATLQEVIPLEMPIVPPKRAMLKAQEAVTCLIGEMIAVDGQPFSLVEDIAFRRLLQHLAPWYSIPSRRTMSQQLLPAMHCSAVAMVKAQLSRAQGRTVHFTADLRSIRQHSYLFLTAHWWQPEDLSVWTVGAQPRPQEGTVLPPGYKVVLLHAQRLAADHTAQNIAAVIQSSLRKWVGGGNIVRGYVVTDASASMLAAVKAVRLKGIVCLAHTLHLVVKDALGLGSTVRATWDTATLEIRALLETCRHLAAHFSCGVASAHLQGEEEDEPEHRLILDLPTRWNSTYAMIAHLVQQKSMVQDVISSMTLLHGEEVLSISSNDWLALSQMVRVLKPFKDTTDVLCTHKASLGQVIPLIRGLDRALASVLQPGPEGTTVLPQVRALAERLQVGITTRLHPLCKEREYKLSCICDPRIKGSIAIQNAELMQWKHELCKELWRLQASRYGQREQRVGEAEEEKLQHSTSSSTRENPQYWLSVVNWEISSSRVARSAMVEDSAELMVREYLAESLEPSDANPLEYWSRKAAIWPDLACVAMSLLSCPPSSVQSEQVFSHMGNILGTHHSHLSPAKAVELAFLKVNLPLLGYPSLDLSK